MSLLFKIGLISVVLLLFLFYKCSNHKPIAHTDDILTKADTATVTIKTEINPFGDCSETTRTLLVTHCGSCHQSSLPTQKAGALAIFDLDKHALWHEDLKEHHLQGIGRRLLGKSDISDEQKEAVNLFLELKEEQLKTKAD